MKVRDDLWPLCFKIVLSGMGMIIALSLSGTIGLSEELQGITPDTVRESLVENAKKYIGTRYVRGGSSEKGFDCSGFVVFLYRQYGLNLSRTTESQYSGGVSVELGDAKPGDLVFFRIYHGRISHVGIYLGDMQFIHATKPGRTVTIDSMTSSYWKERFAGAVSYNIDYDGAIPVLSFLP